jgi:hypothetical protein
MPRVADSPATFSNARPQSALLQAVSSSKSRTRAAKVGTPIMGAAAFNSGKSASARKLA